MKIELTKNIKIKEIVDIDFPFYCKHVHHGEYHSSVTYMKAEAKLKTDLRFSKDIYGEVSFEIVFEKIAPNWVSGYLEEENKSSEAEFLAAKAKMLEALKGI